MTAALVDLAGRINTAHAAAVASAGAALAHAAEAGRLLLAVKRATPHGTFGAWVRAHCPDVAPRTARLYMRVARRWSELEAAQQNGNALPLREAARLLAEPHRSPDTEPDAWGVHDMLAQRAAIYEGLVALEGDLAVAGDLAALRVVVDRASGLLEDAMALKCRCEREAGRLLSELGA